MQIFKILMLTLLCGAFFFGTIHAAQTQMPEGVPVVKCNCCSKCSCLQTFQGTKVLCSVCNGKCNCCEKCRCYKARFDRTEAMNAGKGEYIISGVAKKDGPYYRIYLSNGKSIKMAVTSKTELLPVSMNPETAGKLLVRYKNDQGMYQAVQIHSAKLSHIAQAVLNGQKVYVIVENKK